MPITLRTAHPPPAVVDEIAALCDADLLRLRAIARLRARGLPGVEGLDLLNEALLRLLDGSRSRPGDVPLVAVVAQTMRSIAHDHWRRARREGPSRDASGPAALRQPDPSPTADPERATAAAQALAEVDRLFAADPAALQIVAGLAEGLDAAEIRRRYGLDATTYDSARRRMRRALLRQDGDGGRP